MPYGLADIITKHLYLCLRRGYDVEQCNEFYEWLETDDATNSQPILKGLCVHIKPSTANHAIWAADVPVEERNNANVTQMTAKKDLGNCLGVIMSRNRPPRIEPKLCRPSYARSDWRVISINHSKTKITIGQKPHKWYNSFPLERREKRYAI